MNVLKAKRFKGVFTHTGIAKYINYVIIISVHFLTQSDYSVNDVSLSGLFRDKLACFSINIDHKLDFPYACSSLTSPTDIINVYIHT